MSTDEKARVGLPLWFILGNAAPEISKPWWHAMLNEYIPSHMDPRMGKFIAMDQVKAFDEEMYDLYQQPKYAVYPMLYAPQELRDYYAFLKGAGLHSGMIPPRLEPERKNGHKKPQKEAAYA